MKVLLVASAAAFSPVANPAARLEPLQALAQRSLAMPMCVQPPNLDGSLAGDTGFDPAGFTNNPRVFPNGRGGISSGKWFREAELTHGRVAMLAALGWIAPELFGRFPQASEYSLNPLEAVNQVGPQIFWGFFLIIAPFEMQRNSRVIQGDEPAGSSWAVLGQGGYNPFEMQRNSRVIQGDEPAGSSW